MEEEYPLAPPRLTDREAAELIGKTIIIGATYLDARGEELQRTQMHGIVSHATTRSVEISLRGARHGTTFSLPPDPRLFVAGKPGKYTLHSTGEVIENPQVLCTVVINKPQSQ